jgi:hypothetical protein
MRLHVLSLFDRTGAMVRPWLEAGHAATIVDIQHAEGIGHDGALSRVGLDVLDPNAMQLLRLYLSQAHRKPDVVFAFPPCTHLASSGARWWKSKGPEALAEAMFMVGFARHVIKTLVGEKHGCWMLENPVGRLSSHWRRPDHSFNPCDYGGYLSPPGDAYTKRTCLWAGGGFVMPVPRPTPPLDGSRMHRLPPGPERQNLRSATPEGFARAVFEANEPRLLEAARCSTVDT